MVRRTTIEIDEELLERAKRALNCDTTRATVEESLRRAAADAEAEHEHAVERLNEYFEKLPTLVDMDVLQSNEMWR